jgi:hypothetical protein
MVVTTAFAFFGTKKKSDGGKFTLESIEAEIDAAPQSTTALPLADAVGAVQAALSSPIA